jgi:hypothetical protein
VDETVENGVRQGGIPDGFMPLLDRCGEWEKRTDLRMLQRHKAGEKLFVDYAGVPAHWTDQETGEVRQTPVFVFSGMRNRKPLDRNRGEELSLWTGLPRGARPADQHRVDTLGEITNTTFDKLQGKNQQRAATRSSADTCS